MTLMARPVIESILGYPQFGVKAATEKCSPSMINCVNWMAVTYFFHQR